MRLLHEVRGVELRLFGIANPRRERREEDLARERERDQMKRITVDRCIRKNR